MKALVTFLLIAACILPEVFAQLKVDTLRVEAISIPVIHTRYSRDVNGNISEEEDLQKTTFKSWYLMDGDSTVADTLVLLTGFHPYCRLHFSEDSTKLSAFHRLGGELEELVLEYADVIRTPRKIEVYLDSAALHAVKFNYQSHYWWSDTAGTSFYAGKVFSGVPLSRTSVKVTYVLASTSDVHETSPIHTFTVFPNPVSDILNVQASSDQILVSIHDLLGREVLRSTVSGEAQIDVSKLQPGVYMLSVGGQMRKIVVE